MTRNPANISLRRSLALSTALGVSLAMLATPAAAQLPVVTPFGVVTPGGTSGEAGAARPVITSNPIPGGTAVNFRLNARSTVLNWTSFNIPEPDTANFVNTTSTQTVAVLNRVTLQNPINTTTLAGRINAVNSATGSAGAGLDGTKGVEVWIANPNGIILGPRGNFNTQGFIATTRSFDATDISNFLAGTGQLTLTAPSGFGAVPNSGITGTAGIINSNGRVQAFIAPVIQLNGGTFNAGAGDVAFVIASDVTISNPGSPLAMTINAGTALNGTAQRIGGTVQAGSAYAIISAQAGVDALLNISAGATTASASGGVVVLSGRHDAGSTGSFTFANTGSGNTGGADVTVSGALTANNGGSVRVTGAQSITLTGALTTTGGGAVQVNGYDNSVGNVVAVSGPVTSSGGYSVTGGQVVLGATNATVTQQAAGAVTVRSLSSSLTSRGTLTLNSDTDGNGGAMLLRGRDGIDLAPTGAGNANATIIGGVAAATAAGTITFDTDTAGSVFRLGNVRAGMLNQVVGGTASAGLSRTGAISTGALTLSGANTVQTGGLLTTGAVTTGASATTLIGNGVTVGAAIGNLAGQTGGVTVDGGTGFVSLQGSDLAGALSVTARGVQFTDLAGAGAKTITSTAGITGATIKGAGAVDLSAPTTSPIAITGSLGAPAARLGALTVNGGGQFRLGAADATGTTAYLSSASFGQTTPTGALQTFGAVDVGGTFTATAGTVTMGDVVSGGALLVNGGVGGASFRDLTGAGTKTIAAAGPIGIRSVGGAGAVTLSVTGANTAINVTQGIGAGADPVGALTIDGGDVTLNGFTVAGATSLGQTRALTGLVVTGAADTGSLVADASGAMVFGSLRARTGDLDLASVGGGITFGGAVDGPAALVVRAAPTAVVVFGGAVGGSTPFATVASNGAGKVLLNGGSVTTVGAQRYDGALLLGANTVLTGAGATFSGGVNGAIGGADHDLALNFSGMQSLNGGDFVGIRNLATDTIGAPAGGTTLSGLVRTSGAQLFNDAVTLGGATELRSTGAVGGGAITFAGTVNGSAALTVATPGLLTFAGDVGVTSALTSIAAGGATGVAIQGGRVNTTGGQAYGATALNGALTTGVTLTAGADGVSFAGLNGPRGLTVNTAGPTTLAGGAAPLDFITTDAGGATSLAGTIATVNTQTYNDVVSLAAATTLNGALAVFGAGVTGNGNDLTINTSGVQELDGITGVNNLQTDAQVFAGGAGILRLTRPVVTSGDQRYGEAQLIVAADVELKAGAGKVIDITAPINGDGETHALTLTAGQTRLRGDVGMAAGGRLASLTVNGGLELLGQPSQRISTVGVQTYDGLVQLRTGATFIGGGASFAGGVDGDAQAFNDLTLTFANASTLPANGLTNIGSLRIDGAGATTLNGDVATRDGQFYGSTVVLGGPVTLSSSNAGAITLGAVKGAQALTVNTAGVTTFDQGLSGLRSITTDAAGSTLLNAGLSTTGAISLGDPVTLGADVAVLSTGGGALSFGGAITGPHALTVGTSGLTSFAAAVGATLPDGTPDTAISPTALTSTGGGAVAINGGAITTSGAQRYAGQVRLGANTALTGSFGSFGAGIAGAGNDLALFFSNGLSVTGSISGINNFTRGGGGSTALAGAIDTIGGQTYLNNVTLLGDTVLTSGGGTGTGAISFLGTVDGGQSLTVTSGGLTTFNAAVGATTPLSSITIGAGGVVFNGGAVRTTGAQSYAGPATLGVDTRLLTSGGDISLGAIDGAHVLSLGAGTGAVALNGRVGGATALTGLAIRANSASSAASGNRVGTLALRLDAGPFSYDDAGALTVGTVDGLVGITTGGATTLSAGGLLTLDAAVSGGALALTGTGVLQNAGAAVTATGAITIDANDGAIALNDRLATADAGGGAVRLIDAADVRIGAITTGAGGTVVLGLAGGDNLSGALTQGAGVITAGRLVGSVGGAALLTNRNLIGTLGAFSANGFSLRQANGFAVMGPVNAGAGGLLLQNDAGAMVLGGDLVTQGTVTLTSGGAISQPAGGITAASLAGSSAGGLSLTSVTNAVPVLAGLTNTGGGGIAFTDSVALTVTADLAGGAGLVLSAPGLSFDGRLLSAAGDVTLDARQAKLTGGTVTAGGDLSVAGGTVGLTAATAGRTLALTAGNGGLTVSGAVNAGGDASATSTGAVTLNGFGATATPIGGAATITAGGALTVASVNANGAATLSAAGAIGAGSLTGGSVTATGLSVDLGAASAATTLALTATGGLLQVGTGGAGGSASLTASDALTVGESLTTGGDATLDAGGLATVKAVTSTGGNVTVQGGVLLVTAANAAKSLVASARTGDATVTAATVGGDAAFGAAGATSVGTLTVGGAARLTAGGALSLGTGDVTGAATLSAMGPVTVGTSLTSGGAASLTSGGTATVAAITSTGAGVSISGADVSVASAKAATALSLGTKNGALSLTDGGAATADLTSAGALDVGGLITSGAATLSAAGNATVAAISSTSGGVSITGADVSVTDAKAATALGVDTKGGVLSLTNGAAETATLTSAGALNAGVLTTSGAASLSATGPLTVATSLTSGGAATLATAGDATVAGITSTGAGVSISGLGVSVSDAKAATALAIETKGGLLSLGNGAAETATLTSAGALTTGSLTTSGAATLSANGPLTVATALTSGGAASATTTGNAMVAAITSTGAGVSVNGAGVSVGSARAAGAVALTSRNGPLALTNGVAATATLASAGTLNTGALTTTGAATLTATGAAMLGQSTIGAALTVTANGVTAGQTNAGALLMTSGGAITVAGAQVGGDASFDANGLASLGAVTAGSAGAITVKALDAAITGTQRAGTVTFVNRQPGSVATRLGNGTSAGGFSLSADEVNHVEAGQLTINAGGGAIEIGALALDVDAGRSRVDVMTTGRIDVTGAVSGSGAGRTVRLGGSTAAADDKASVISVVATPTGGGRLLMDTADLELRGTRIGVGQTTGFLDALGLTGGTGAPTGVAATYVGDANSALYNSAIGGFPYPAGATLVAAKSLTVRYTDYALFQNTGAPGQTSGVALSPGASAPGALTIQGPGGTALNAFALFGTIGGIAGTSTALLGPSVIPVTGANLAATRVNGCLVGSGAGCLTAVVVQPLLSVFDSSRTDVFRPADDLAVPFDPVVGTSNESLFAEIVPADDGVTGTQCTADTTSPGCGQTQELQK